MNYTLQKFKKQPQKIKKIIKSLDCIRGFTTKSCILKQNNLKSNALKYRGIV
jgi:hypothetical protein